MWGYKLPYRRYSTLTINFQLKSVSDVEILSHLKKLKRNCATGLDDVPACFLKDTAYVIAKPLTHMINLSLSTGIVPNELKAARVNPVFKTGETHKFDNYRPISILPVISKIFEKCVHNQLMNYLESNKLLSSKQFGFRRKRSTELATAYLIDKIRHAVDKDEYTGAIYVDLNKAFDTISHAMIVNKLPQFDITSVAQQWIASYLFARQQQVRYKGILSPPSPIFCGVSQGSI